MEATPEVPADYERLIATIREVVHRVVPVNASVLVASRGDEQLLELGPRKTLHFPQDERGKYVGYHPADSDHAIKLIEEMREKGAEYFLLPNTAFWWLDYYDGLRRYLESRYRVVEAGDDCWIAQLSDRANLAASTVAAPVADRDFMLGASSHQHLMHPLREVIGNLLPSHATIAFLAVGHDGLEGISGGQTWLLPADSSNDPETAIESLKRLETSGIEYLILPHPIFDWLEDHPEVSEHLGSHHRFVTRQEHLCEIYEIHHSSAAASPAPSPPEPPFPEPPSLERSSHVSEESNPGRRSFGETLRGFLFPSRRNGSQD